MTGKNQTRVEIQKRRKKASRMAENEVEIQKDGKQWEIKKRKLLREKKHQSTKKIIPEKNVGVSCKDTCRYKCSVNIEENTRKQIHTAFWSSNKDINHKRQFIASCVKSVSISRKRCRTGKRTDKSQARKYFFDNHGQTVRACKMFFRNTLATDERGRHGNHSKIPEFVRQAVRDHIMQFPVEDSHYSRERTKRKYLGNHLNLSKIYNLCTNVCEEKNLPV